MRLPIASVLAILGIGCGGEEPKPTNVAPGAPEVAALPYEEANERFNAMRPALEAIRRVISPRDSRSP